ncbi:hypothetical protein ACRALDRAFT_1074631 [Sodiomyces alcalophilus JCM 7366]|uniref:uncharacterized protein n=1 Tax=Sodiomyces alcalophilus JCM 7366 TaxID=591952 RepID=UPI0039B5619E
MHFAPLLLPRYAQYALAMVDVRHSLPSYWKHDTTLTVNHATSCNLLALDNAHISKNCQSQITQGDQQRTHPPERLLFLLVLPRRSAIDSKRSLRHPASPPTATMSGRL